MPNDFDDVRLPEDIERGTTGGPGFRTTVISMVGGGERRNQEWEFTRSKFNIGYGIRKRDDMEEVYSFFHERRGRLRGFRFKNWLDFQVVAGPVGSIAGQANKRQLVRVYGSGDTAYIRSVTRPVPGSVKLFVNNVATNAFTLGPMGVVTFTGGDPGNNVAASFEFDTPVRFDTDDLNVQLNTFKEGTFPSIQLIELQE